MKVILGGGYSNESLPRNGLVACALVWGMLSVCYRLQEDYKGKAQNNNSSTNYGACLVVYV